MPPKPHDAQTDEHPHSQSYSCFSREGRKKKREKRHLRAGTTVCWEVSHSKCWEHCQSDSRSERPVTSTCRSYPGIGWLWLWEVLGNPGVHPTVGVLVTHWRASYFFIQLERRKVRPKNFEKLKRLLKWLPLCFWDEDRHLWVSPMEGCVYNEGGAGHGIPALLLTPGWQIRGWNPTCPRCCLGRQGEKVCSFFSNTLNTASLSST